MVIDYAYMYGLYKYSVCIHTCTCTVHTALDIQRSTASKTHMTGSCESGVRLKLFDKAEWLGFRSYSYQAFMKISALRGEISFPSARHDVPSGSLLSGNSYRSVYGKRGYSCGSVTSQHALNAIVLLHHKKKNGGDETN